MKKFSCNDAKIYDTKPSTVHPLSKAWMRIPQSLWVIWSFPRLELTWQSNRPRQRWSNSLWNLQNYFPIKLLGPVFTARRTSIAPSTSSVRLGWIIGLVWFGLARSGRPYSNSELDFCAVKSVAAVGWWHPAVCNVKNSLKLSIGAARKKQN